MSGPVAIYVADGVRDRHGTDAVLASLPLSYAPSAEAVESGITVVDGASDWPTATAQALASGAAGVIVAQPRPADLGALPADGIRPGVVVVDSIWASNPVVSAAASAFRAAAGRRLECRIVVQVGTSLTGALLDQLSLVRALVGPAAELRILYQSAHGFIGEARAGERAVDLSVVCTDAVPEHARVRLLTGDGSVDLRIPGGKTARPARLTVTAPDGAVLAPTLYESGHRASWRRLRQLITTGGSTTDLEDLETDIATASVLRDTEG